MRELCLILVLVNLGFLAWTAWLAPQEEPPPPRDPDNTIPRLLLVSELQAAQAEGTGEKTEVPAAYTAADPPTALAAVTEPVPRCVALGPFPELPEAMEAVAKLQEQGLTPSERLAESQQWVGHWVHLPAFPSRAEARVAVEALREQGVRDIYIEPGGDYRNAVGLGLYRNRDLADARADTIRELGYETLISDRHRQGSVYWVDVQLAPDLELDPAEYQTRPGRIIRLEPRRCPGAGGSITQIGGEAAEEVEQTAAIDRPEGTT